TRPPPPAGPPEPAESGPRQGRVQAIAEFFLGERSTLCGVPFNEPLFKSAFQFGARQGAVLIGIRGGEQARRDESHGTKPRPFITAALTARTPESTTEPLGHRQGFGEFFGEPIPGQLA